MDNLHLAVFLTVLGAAVAGYCSSYRDPYGRYHSGFNCPQLFDNYRETSCCTTSTKKYCCEYGDDSFWITRTIVGLIFAVGAVIFVIVIISCCCCATCPLYRRRTQGRVLSTNVGTTTTVTSANGVVYTNSSAGMVPQGGYPGYPPAQPPPGYGAPMPPSYAPAYPPPQYPAGQPPAYMHPPGQQPPPPPQNLYGPK